VAPNPRITFLPGAAGERALVARLMAGDELAYRECYETHAPRTLRVLLRMLGDRGKAEDVLQETFVAAFKKIAQFRGDAQLGTWITGIAIRRALNHVRDAGRRLPAATTDAIEPPAELPGEESHLASRDLARHLLVRMEQLEPARRLALLLFAEGYTASEIGELTGAPRSTVLSQIARGRAELLAWLGDDADVAAGKGRSRG
jgi:RNA polymerase sigma-70 factor (ECF subfamily)